MRREIYDLMTHPGYHSLEKELTESLLQTNELYNALRAFSRDRGVPPEQRESMRDLFAYIIFREMNLKMGGFHFDRYKSLTTGELQDRLMSEVLESLDFNEFLVNFAMFTAYSEEPGFDEFVAQKQSRFLEDSITSAIKKNNVIPALGRAIAQDVVDALHLTENFGYLRASEEAKEELFEFAEESISEYVALRKIAIVVEGESFRVLLKRTSRTSNQFRYLLTDFGALIKGL